MITRTVVEIQLRSLKGCLHHMQSFDLDELAAGATVYGTAADLDLIGATRAFLAPLPLIHP